MFLELVDFEQAAFALLAAGEPAVADTPDANEILAVVVDCPSRQMVLPSADEMSSCSASMRDAVTGIELERSAVKSWTRTWVPEPLNAKASLQGVNAVHARFVTAQAAISGTAAGGWKSAYSARPDRRGNRDGHG